MKLNPIVLPVALSGLFLFLSGCSDSAPTDEAVEVIVEEESLTTEEVPTEEGAESLDPELTFETLEDKVSYGVGYQFGISLARQMNLELNRAAINAGIEDSLNGADIRISQEELQAAFGEMQAQDQANTAAVAPANLAAAEAFLETNGAREGVVTTESGLQYEIITEGTGALPAASDTVEVHYHGTLLDGTVFDSSVDRGETSSFPVQGVIPGWVEGLQLMPVGSKWRLFIHPSLAYGERGSGPSIGPNSALIFEVEIFSIAGQ